MTLNSHYLTHGSYAQPHTHLRSTKHDVKKRQRIFLRVQWILHVNLQLSVVTVGKCSHCSTGSLKRPTKIPWVWSFPINIPNENKVSQFLWIRSFYKGNLKFVNFKKKILKQLKLAQINKIVPLAPSDVRHGKKK